MSLDDPFEQVHWMRPEPLEGWEFLVAHRSRHLWTYFHEAYDLCALSQGGPTWYYRGRVTVSDGAGTMLLEPGETHRTVATVPTGVQFKVAIIPREAVAAAAVELGVSPTPHLVRLYTRDPRLTQAVWCLGELVETGQAERLELQTLQNTVLNLLLAHSENPPAPLDSRDRRVSLAADYLHSHFNQSISLDQLAASAGLSRFTLVRAFSRRYGMPPHAFQLQLRILRARTLLIKGVPAGLTAAEVGFCDQSHFSRHFKRIMRVNPGEYARSAGIQSQSHRRRASRRRKPGMRSIAER